MNPTKLRAWWFHRQGLGSARSARPAAEVLAGAGWARSVGGCTPYLTLFARAGIAREAADRAAAQLEIHELPSARGCTYVLPAADFALGLKAGQAFAGAEMKLAGKLGVTEKEVDRLCEAVLGALGAEALDPAQLKDAVGPAARSLGEEGKKKGLGNTMPLALERLQVTGAIRRVPVDGRLDGQRYRYARWDPNPLDRFPLSAEQVHTELARRYFRWTGPATVAEFQWFSGLGVKAARAAMAPLGLVPFDDEIGRLILPADLEAFHSFRHPLEPEYALVGSIDSLVLLRRDLASMIDPPGSTRTAGPLSDLPSHGILDRGRLIGLWEFDPESRTIAWESWVEADHALRKAVAETESFVREQLGDARAFSLDSPRSRATRIAALRAAQPSG